MKILKKLVLNPWEDFWFSPVNTQRLGLMRLILGGTFFFLYGFRQFRIDFFDERSLIPRAEQLSVFPDFFKPFFSWNFWPDSWSFEIHLLFVLLLLLFFLGFSNRILMLLTWVLHMGFCQRNYSHLFGADVIGGIFLLYLSLTDCHKTWSLRNWILKTKSNEPQKVDDCEHDYHHDCHSDSRDLLTPVFFRIMQIQISVIYAYTGFEKLKGATWWDGTALWTVLANPQMTIYPMTWTRHVPLFIAAMTFTTILFEIYFPAAILIPKIRPYWLLAGIFFHAGIGLLLGLLPFSLVMISTYSLFITVNKPKFLQRYL